MEDSHTTEPTRERLRPRNDISRWRIEAVHLTHEIVATAERILAARNRGDAFGTCTDAVWSLLGALERAGRWLSISDVARALCTSRQAAQSLVRRAARGGHVETVSNPHDRRLVRIGFTERGRTALADARHCEIRWVIVLLNGFDMREIVAVTQMLRVYVTGSSATSARAANGDDGRMASLKSART